jgi:hypothetical protein
MGHLPTKLVLFGKSENIVLPDLEGIKKLCFCLLGESMNMIKKFVEAVLDCGKERRH